MPQHRTRYRTLTYISSRPPVALPCRFIPDSRLLSLSPSPRRGPAAYAQNDRIPQPDNHGKLVQDLPSPTRSYTSLDDD